MYVVYRYQVSDISWQVVDLAAVHMLSVRSSYCTYATTQPPMLFCSPPQVLVATLLVHRYCWQVFLSLACGLSAVCAHIVDHLTSIDRYIQS